MSRTPAETVAHFDGLYSEHTDPWGYRDSPYERGKYAATMAALPRPHYRRVWEPGCSIGELTRLLATRADRVQAEDASPEALRIAAAGPTPPGVSWERRMLPEGPSGPDGGFDLVVLSEVLYYLDAADRADVAVTTRRLLAPGGDVVAVHYRLPASDYTVSGDVAAVELGARPGLVRTSSRVEEKFRIDVLTSA